MHARMQTHTHTLTVQTKAILRNYIGMSDLKIFLALNLNNGIIQVCVTMIGIAVLCMAIKWHIHKHIAYNLYIP